MQQISIVGHSGKYIGLSSEALMSSKLKPAKLACPPNSKVDKCGMLIGNGHNFLSSFHAKSTFSSALYFALKLHIYMHLLKIGQCLSDLGCIDKVCINQLYK